MLHSLLKYFPHSKGSFVSPSGHIMPSMRIFCSLFSIGRYCTVIFSFSIRDLSRLHRCIYSNSTIFVDRMQGISPWFTECWSETKLAALIRQELHQLKNKFIHNSIHCALEFINFKDAQSIYCVSLIVTKESMRMVCCNWSTSLMT